MESTHKVNMLKPVGNVYVQMNSLQVEISDVTQKARRGSVQIFRAYGTVNFLNIRTPKKFVVITLKFELCGSTIE